MVAGAEIIHQSLTVVDVSYRCIAKGIEEAVDVSSPVTAVAAEPPAVISSATVADDLVRFLNLIC